MAEPSRWTQAIDELKIELINNAYELFGDPFANKQVAAFLGLPLSNLIAEMKRLGTWSDEGEDEDQCEPNPAVGPRGTTSQTSSDVHAGTVGSPGGATTPLARRAAHWIARTKFLAQDGVRICAFKGKGAGPASHYWRLTKGMYSTLRRTDVPPAVGTKQRAIDARREAYSPTGKEPHVGCPVHRGSDWSTKRTPR